MENILINKEYLFLSSKIKCKTVKPYFKGCLMSSAFENQIEGNLKWRKFITEILVTCDH